jgi:hypothetical protein
MLETAQLPIHEPGLDQIVARNGTAGRLHFMFAPELAEAAGIEYHGIGRLTAATRAALQTPGVGAG